MTASSPLGASAARRRVVVSAPQELVSVADSPHSIVSLIRPKTPMVDLVYWLRSNREQTEDLLCSRGAILFRGFRLSGPAEFQRVVQAWSPQLLNYSYGSSPRSRSGVTGIYTSTEYPADQSIPQHNEMSYARIWPKHLWFYCDKAAAEGGSTPLADSSRVAARLSRTILASFAERGVRYVRNYGTGFDLSWQQAFETSSRADVAALCRAQGIEFTWYDENKLRTSQVCQAVIEHPVTGAEVWFNQAHLFHVSSLPAEISTELLKGDDLEFPRHAYFGNGEPIPDSALDEVRAAYAGEIVREPWQDGDVLLIDNMLVSHGRDPYRGPRRVLVAMTDEYRGYAGEA
jgi:alpha-ketoglutarate-dependent taurine dioxygenase